jgi:hypothetical protein
MRIKGPSETQDATFCSYFTRLGPLRFPVLECSAYDDKRLPQLEDMRMTAIYISVDKKTGKIGFKTAQEQNGGYPVSTMHRIKEF